MECTNLPVLLSGCISQNIKRCDRQFLHAKLQVADLSRDVECLLQSS